MELITINMIDRQLEGLLFWKEIGEFTNSKYVSKLPRGRAIGALNLNGSRPASKFNITVRTGLRDIAELVEKELLIKSGNLKTTKYLYRNNNVQ